MASRRRISDSWQAWWPARDCSRDVHSKGATWTVKGDARKVLVVPWTEADNVRRQLFGPLEVGPVLLSQQFESELELVVQRKAVDRVRDGRSVRNHPLHIPQSPPGCLWW